MPAKEHISITLDEQVLRRVDRLVDGKNTKNRSHAIEKLLSQYLDEQAVKQAVVLCGGHGADLEPITQEIPKPMIPVKGKPILEYVINHLKSEGITDIVLAVDYMHDKIISHFGNGSKFGVNIRYVVEQKPLGTAGSLAPLKEMLSDTFVLLYGDILSKVDMQGMLRVHRSTKTLVTMALTTAPETKGYGVAKLRGDKIIGFSEKPNPEHAESNLINAGVFIVEPELLTHQAVKKSERLLERVFEKLAPKGELAGYVYSGPWYDLETNEKYGRAIKEWR